MSLAGGRFVKANRHARGGSALREGDIERVTSRKDLKSRGCWCQQKEGNSQPDDKFTVLRPIYSSMSEAVSAPDARMEWPGAQTAGRSESSGARDVGTSDLLATFYFVG